MAENTDDKDAVFSVCMRQSLRKKLDMIASIDNRSRSYMITQAVKLLIEDRINKVKKQHNATS